MAFKRRSLLLPVPWDVARAEMRWVVRLGAMGFTLLAAHISIGEDGAPAGTGKTNVAVVLTNSLGMQFRSVPGVKSLFSVWETRVRDYEAFVRDRQHAWSRPGFEQGPMHPVANVNWEDASAFCRWLTDTEREAGKLSGKQKYRLPTDEEWSIAAGMGVERGNTPEARMKQQRVWPWGAYWPPVAGDGNYGEKLKVDSHPATSPVGSYRPNAHGLFDMGGNVWEWTEDWYNEATVTKALRGGSFNDSQPSYLTTSYRLNGTMNLINEDFGFRVVLENPE